MSSLKYLFAVHIDIKRLDILNTLIKELELQDHKIHR